MISPLSSDCLAACVWKCWNGLYFSTKKASVPLKGQKLNIILKYSGIKKFMEDIVEKAKQQGYVET